MLLLKRYPRTFRRKKIIQSYRFKIFLVFLLIWCDSHTFANSQKQIVLPYKNPNLSSYERTFDLLSRMTLEEKIGQLICLPGWDMYQKSKKTVTYSPSFKLSIDSGKIGMLWATFRADPWTKKDFETGLTPSLSAKTANELQRYAVIHTRLGIPLFFAEEAPHGHMAIGTTVFPTAIGQAATFNPNLVKQMGFAIAKELKAQGAHIGYGPILDLARDPRWSRVEETYGEDPELIAIMGASFVSGMRTIDSDSTIGIIPTLKHFAAYGIPEGGQNGGACTIGERELRESFLYPFKEAIRAGALSVMSSYNSIDGIPCTMNYHLFSTILRKEWGFKGFAISDLYSIDGISNGHQVASTIDQAAILAATAGIDVDLGGKSYPTLNQSVRNGKFPIALIDSAVFRILELKFKMGLFENPYVNQALAEREVNTSNHIELARKIAQQSIVLLENKNNILPLRKDNIKIALIGPNANNMYNMLGDYTAPQKREKIRTVFDGISLKIGKENINYSKGCNIRDTTEVYFSEVTKIVNQADVAIVVVGGSSARDFKTNFHETGAASLSGKELSDMESGEGYDRATLDLLGKQLELLKVVKSTGKPLIVIYIQGRPLNMNWAKENADALLTAWYPGQEGGNAVADIIFGDYNPSGKLPVSVPAHVGQLPVYYNKKNPKSHNYVEFSPSPLYSFGYGKSYTQFAYSNLAITKTGYQNYNVEFDLKNDGEKDGIEIPQLYISHQYASVVQPSLQLKSFQQVFLKKKESKRIRFDITDKQLNILDAAMKTVANDGKIVLMIGAASNDIKLSETVQIRDAQFSRPTH